MSQNRIPWNQYFMMQALIIGQCSTCNRALANNVLIRDKRAIGTEYSGLVVGQEHCGDVGHQMMDERCIRTIYSEMGTLIQRTESGVSTLGAEIYVAHFPCYNCTKALIQAGIKRANYLLDCYDNPLAVELLKKTGVEVNQIKLDSNCVRDLIEKIVENEN